MTKLARQARAACLRSPDWRLRFRSFQDVPSVAGSLFPSELLSLYLRQPTLWPAGQVSRAGLCVRPQLRRARARVARLKAGCFLEKAFSRFCSNQTVELPEPKLTNHVQLPEACAVLRAWKPGTWLPVPRDNQQRPGPFVPGHFSRVAVFAAECSSETPAGLSPLPRLGQGKRSIKPVV